MTRKLCQIALALGFFFTLETAFAQDYEYHPALSDRFLFTLGAFKSDNLFKLSASRAEQAKRSEIDFGNTIGVDENTTVFNGQLRWKFGEEMNWSLWGQYFQNNATGKAVLKKDVDWDDLTFKQGSSVGGEVKAEVIRIFIGRSLVNNQQNDFGIGFGLHNMKLSAFIEGEVLLEDNATAFRKADASNSAPLPNLGSWYNFSPARNWLLHGRVDWMSANIGDYDGTLWNASAGVNYQFSRNFGIDASYQLFNINVNVDKSDWQGSVDLRYRGPVVSVTANW